MTKSCDSRHCVLAGVFGEISDAKVAPFTAWYLIQYNFVVLFLKYAIEWKNKERSQKPATHSQNIRKAPANSQTRDEILKKLFRRKVGSMVY